MDMTDIYTEKTVELRDGLRNEIDLGCMNLQFYGELDERFRSVLDLIEQIKKERYTLTNGERFVISLINCKNNVSVGNIIDDFPKVTDNPWDTIDIVTKIIRRLMDRQIIYKSYNSHLKNYIYIISKDYYDEYQLYTNER
jgi:hypothetical protein